MIKLRLFLLSYLIFFKMFTSQFGNYSDCDLKTRKLLNAMLLHGGGNILKSILQEQIHKFKVRMNDPNTLPAIKEEILEESRELSKSLCFPWFAFDECHVPVNVWRGYSFHSDYKHPTSFFSNLRVLLEDLLADAKYPVMSLFASLNIRAGQTFLTLLAIHNVPLTLRNSRTNTYSPSKTSYKVWSA